MKTKKRKGTTLPRLTVMAWSKRELAAFVLAVEQLGHHVRDLADEVDRLKAKIGPRKVAEKATDALLKCNGYSPAAATAGKGVEPC